MSTIQFERDTYPVQEGETINIVVTRTGDPTNEVTVQVRTRFQEAASSSDINYKTQTLQWRSGDSDPKTIALETIADNFPEADESFSLLLWGVKGAKYGTPKEALIVIGETYQQLTPPEFQLFLNDVPVEAQGMATIQTGQQKLYSIQLGTMRHFWGEIEGELAITSGTAAYPLKLKFPFKNPLPVDCPLFGGWGEIRGGQGVDIPERVQINNTLRLVMEADSEYVRLEYLSDYPVPLTLVSHQNYLVHLHFAGTVPR